MLASSLLSCFSINRLAELIEQAVTEQEDVLTDPAPRVLFQDFGNSALIFESLFWTQLRPGGDFRRLRSEIRFRIDELFRENDITIAFPQQDVHLDGILKLETDAQKVGPVTPAATEES